MWFSQSGLDERASTSLIKYNKESRREKKCISCGSSVEYNIISNLTGVFCPFCKHKIEIES